MKMRKTFVGLLSLAVAAEVCGCGLFHGDPNDYERGSGGVGVLQPRLQPPLTEDPVPRPVLPTSGTGP
jgi:hypothetical protein